MAAYGEPLTGKKRRVNGDTVKSNRAGSGILSGPVWVKILVSNSTAGSIIGKNGMKHFTSLLVMYTFFAHFTGEKLFSHRWKTCGP